MSTWGILDWKGVLDSASVVESRFAGCMEKAQTLRVGSLVKSEGWRIAEKGEWTVAEAVGVEGIREMLAVGRRAESAFETVYADIAVCVVKLEELDKHLRLLVVFDAVVVVEAGMTLGAGEVAERKTPVAVDVVVVAADLGIQHIAAAVRCMGSQTAACEPQLDLVLLRCLDPSLHQNQ